MKLYLIRHGKTLANEKRCYCGITDLSLTVDGRKELELKKKNYQFIDKKKTLFYTSSLKRSIESLIILFGDVQYQSDERFNEMNFGEFEMHTHQELLKNPHYLEWLKDVEHYQIPGGERSIDQKERVIQAFKEIKKFNKDIVLVTHGGVISILYNYLFPNETKNIYEIQPNNGEGLLIDLDQLSYEKI